MFAKKQESSIPFSYLDDKQQPIGYAMDLCMKIVDAVKAELKMPNLKVNYQLVTSANRIPLMANGTIDLECGSTTNNIPRQEQVWFTMTHFVTANRWIAKKSSNIKSLQDLKGKTIVSTAGTTNIKQITELNTEKNLGLTILPAKDHAEAFLMVETGRAAAFVMDDILLAGQIANARNPADYRILPESLRQEPYSMMLRKGDAPFKALVDRAVGAAMKSGEIEKIYAKWFTSPIPPKGVNLNFPITPAIRDAFKNPNDKGV